MGVTALLVASKYEEIFSPDIADFVYITDNAYTSSEIREMEIMILKELNFNLGRPLPIHFLRRASKAGEVSTCPHYLELSYMCKVYQDCFQHFYCVILLAFCLHSGSRTTQLCNSTMWSNLTTSLAASSGSCLYLLGPVFSLGGSNFTVIVN